MYAKCMPLFGGGILQNMYLGNQQRKYLLVSNSFLKNVFLFLNHISNSNNICCTYYLGVSFHICLDKERKKFDIRMLIYYAIF